MNHSRSKLNQLSTIPIKNLKRFLFFSILLFSAPIFAASQEALQESNSTWILTTIIFIAGLALALFFWRLADKLKLMTKMVTLVFALGSLLTFLSIAAVSSMNSIGKELKTIAEDDIPLTNSVASITIHQLQQALWLERGAIAANLTYSEKNRFENAASRFQQYARQVDEEIIAAEHLAEKALEHATDDATRAEFQRVLSSLKSIEAQHRDFNRRGSEVFQLARSGELASASTLLLEVENQEDKLDHELQALEKELAEFTAAAAVTAEIHEIEAEKLLITVSIESILIALILAALVLRSTRNQLGADPKELQTIASQMAEGNLDIHRPENVTGVYLSILETVDRLKDIIIGIKLGAEEVSTASEQVSQGNMDLSQRTQEQASNLEEVAASMEELATGVLQNADNAQMATQLAVTARDQADAGGEVVNKLVSSMSEINESSSKISEIIGVINEIAFQTNLLALNAAVEAARAGDQGRGFGVVAGEVRALAGRSANAAKEIKMLIEDSVSKVENGTEWVNQSGTALENILSSVSEVSEVVTEIASASKEQSGGINQVNTAIVQMDDMTQKNAALVEEAAAASETMGAQAQELQASINFFQLGKSEEDALRRRMVKRDAHRFQSGPDRAQLHQRQTAMNESLSFTASADYLRQTEGDIR